MQFSYNLWGIKKHVLQLRNLLLYRLRLQASKEAEVHKKDTKALQIGSKVPYFYGTRGHNILALYNYTNNISRGAHMHLIYDMFISVGLLFIGLVLCPSQA